MIYCNPYVCHILLSWIHTSPDNIYQSIQFPDYSDDLHNGILLYPFY